MVIERALAKMRQAAGIKPDAPPASGIETERRKASRPPDARTIVKPTFRAVSVDPAVAEVHRILLPHAQAREDHRAGAAYRMLRTRLLHQLRSNHWKTLAITSPGAGEGKSLSALNLALSVARDKSVDVFLLDLDMRNPSLCAYLGVRPPRELVRYFAGEGGPADALFSIGVENLALAGSTAATEQASELIANGRLEEMIGYINSIAANPIVLIDLPPLLVTDEALLVAPRVDATLLVVSEGRTRRDSLARARQLLADFTCAGVILNCSSENFGADSYYGYGYRYGQPPA
jgi:protein-tyrosine kinase